MGCFWFCGFLGFFFSQLVCFVWFLFWERKSQNPHKPNQTKPGCEYSVDPSLKTSIKSGYKTHLSSQFRIVILMNDTVITEETYISFCQLSVEGNYIFLQRGMFCNKIGEVKNNLNKIIILMASVVGAW